MIGTTISHYKILEKLGEGGMGVVYKAEDLRLKRSVALKFLPSDMTRDTHAKDRFVREAQAVSSLEHSNICNIHEIDETTEGQTFIVMACYEGETLKEKLQRGPLQFDQAIRYTLQIAKGLEQAHRKGIIHRDIKPENIFVTHDDVVKIVDFGLSKLAGRTKFTQTETILGTISYMSPEQTLGTGVDDRTDIWSMCVVLYEMIAGKLPFQGDYDQAVIYSILNEDPVSLSEIDPTVPIMLEKIVAKGLQKDINKRYASMTELVDELNQYQMEAISGRQSISIQARLRYILKRKAPRFVVVIMFAILSLTILFTFLVGRNKLSDWMRLTQVPREKHLAVLPLTVLGGDESCQALSDGLVETISSVLTQLERYKGALWVVPAVETRKLEAISALEARRSFGVNLVITGSMQQMGETIRLTLNLIDTKSLRQLRSIIISDQRENIVSLYDRTIMELTSMMDVELIPHAQQLTLSEAVHPQAYDFYLQALGHLRRYEKLSNIEQAIGLLEEATQLDSTYAAIYAGLGQALWLKYNLTHDPILVDQARESCHRAIQINDQLDAVRITLGIISKGMGDIDQAIDEFTSVIQNDSTNYEATLELAIAYEEKNRLEDAVRMYNKAISLRADYWDAYNCLGHYYWRFGEYEKAEEMFMQVIHLTPDNTRGYNNLLAIYCLLDRMDDAREMFEKSIAIEPNADAYINMGTVEFFQGDYKGAVNKYKKSIELGYNDYITWGNLADAYRYVPEYSDQADSVYNMAIRLAEEQLLVNPKDVRVCSSLALYYAKLGNKDQALQRVRTAHKLAPGDVSVLRNSIIVYELIGQRNHALNSLIEYLNHDKSLDMIESDPDLSRLINDNKYIEIVQNLK